MKLPIPIEPKEALDIFKKTGALLSGHFQLTSGRHSDSYFQCAKVLQHPDHLARICATIANHFGDDGITKVIAPALGGIVVGTEVGRQLAVTTIFAERKDGKMMVRRGFEIDPDDKVLVVEDVITTGGSVSEVIEIVKKAGATLSGVACVVDRSNGKVRLCENQFAVLTLEVVSHTPEECPLCRDEVPIYAPGSRANPQG